MIQIQNQQGDFLHLASGQRLTIEQASTLLVDDERMPGSFSYPIKFPLTDNNQRFLSYAYRPDSLLARMELPVRVSLQGHLYRRCTLRYQITDYQGDGYLVIDSGEVAEKLRKLTLLELLPDLQFGPGLPTTYGNDVPVVMKWYAQQPPSLEPFTFFPIRDGGFMERIQDFNHAQLPGFQARGYLNTYEPGLGGVGSFKVDQPGNYGLHAVPQFYLVWVLKQIMSALGYTLAGDWVEDPETQRLVILGNTAMMSPSRSGSAFRVKAGLHVPDMTAGDFLKAVCQRFGLVVLYNANTATCTIHTFASLVRANIKDLSTYQLQGYSVKAAENEGYSVKELIDEKDVQFQDQFGKAIPALPKIVGLGKTEIQLRAGAPKMMRGANSFPGGIWRVPHVGAPGNLIDALYKDSQRYLDESGKRRNPGTLRFLSYRGLVPDVNGNLYPYATSDGLDPLLKRACAGTDFDGQYGLWEQRLKRYYYFRNNSRTVISNLLMPVSVLNQIRLDERIGLRLESSILAGYLIQKMVFDVAGEDRVKVRLEMQTLPPLPDIGDSIGYVPGETVVWVQMELQLGQMQTIVGNSTTTTQQTAKILLHFFADPAGSIPVEVENLPVNFAIQTQSSINGFSTGSDQATVSGSTAIAFEDITIYRHTTVNNSGEVTEDDYVEYNLDFGDGYNVLQ